MGAYNGSGTFVRTYDWTTDEGNGINVEASRMDTEDDGFATGLSNCITKDGQTTITANIPFATYKITGIGDGSARTDSIALGQVQDGALTTLGTAGGSADVYTASPSPVITAYATGSRFIIKINADNTGASTLNISAVGAKNVKKYDGAGAKVDVEAGDLQQDQYYDIFYDGTDIVVLNPEKRTRVNFPSGGELTISTGVITITQSQHTIDTESDASTDDLDTINGGNIGQILILSTADNARDIVIKNDTGNIKTASGLDLTLSNTNQRAKFQYDGTNWNILDIKLPGDVVQVVNVQDGAVATGTTIIPYDDSIPQNTEGDEYMTLSITPTSSSNKLLIQVVCNIESSQLTRSIMTLFQDSTSDALAAVRGGNITSQGSPAPLVLNHYMTAGTTSSTTFKIRCGQESAATTTFNGGGGSRKFGGTYASSITITEITV